MDRPAAQPRNQKVHLKTAIPGPRSQALRQREEKYVAPGLQRYAVMAGIVAESAFGSAVTDVDGNTFLDIIGGIGVNGLGHSHPKFIKALIDQVQKISVGSFSSEARIELFEKLAEHAVTPRLNRVQLYSSGAEAVESALRLAKCATGKYEFVSFSGGFHGKTMGALSLMGSSFKEKLGPMVPGAHIAPYAYCYRCPVKMQYPSCGMACLEIAEKQIKTNSAGAVAALIVEPIQGAAGNIAPPKEFLPGLRDIAKRLDALLIVDEMITGFGRTGKYWGSEHTGVEADIMTIGKQFGGGFPISAVIARQDVASAAPWSNPSGSSSSYGGNPLAAAAAAAALKIIDEERLVENSRNVGAYFLEKLKPLKDKYPFIGDVRGTGLLLAIEFVEDQRTKAPISKQASLRIFQEFVKRGLLTLAYESTFRMQPSMTIDTGTIDNVVGIIEEVLALVDSEGFWRSSPL